MNERFHPLALGEILDRTAQIYRARFLRFLGVSFVPTLVLLLFLAAGVAAGAVLNAFAGGRPLSGAQDVTLGVIVVLLGLVGVPAFLGAMALSWAALTDAAAATFLGGSFTIREVYGRAWKRRWSVLWLLIMDFLFAGVIPGLIGIAIAAVSAALGALADKSGMNVLSMVIAGAMFVLIGAVAVLSMWLLLRLCLGFAVCVVERASAWQSLKRSSVLGKGTRGRIFVLLLLGYALETGLALGFLFVLVIAIALIPGLQGAKNRDAVSTAIGFGFYGLSFVVQALVRPVYGIGLTLFYFDQRIRKEGFDIEWMMRDAGMESLPPTGGKPAAHAEVSPWLTLPEEPAGGSES